MSAPDAPKTDQEIMSLLREPKARNRARLVQNWAQTWHKAPEAARLRPWALRMSSGVMRRRPAHLETKGAAMPAQQASAEKVNSGFHNPI